MGERGRDRSEEGEEGREPCDTDTKTKRHRGRRGRGERERPALLPPPSPALQQQLQLQQMQLPPVHSKTTKGEYVRNREKERGKENEGKSN